MHCTHCNIDSEVRKVNTFPELSLRVTELKCKHSITEKTQSWQNLQSLFGAKDRLFRYQGLGYEFAKDSDFRCLIADEPGLGKTMQALACLKLDSATLTPTLIIVKSALKIQWARQVLRWLGIEFQPQIISDSKEKPCEIFPIVITTYDILWRMSKKEIDRVEKLELEVKKKLGISEFAAIPKEFITKELDIINPFKEFGFKCLILDECQQIKNRKSKRAQQIQTIAKDIPHVMALSGTPIKNNAGEYFTILNIINPSLFSNYDHYINTDCYVNFSGKVQGLKDVDSFKRKTKDFIIRRTRDEVLPDLPKLVRKFVECNFASAKMQQSYQSALDEFNEFFESSEKKDSEYYTNLLAKMAKLRHLSGLNKVPFTTEWVEEFILDTDKSRKLVIFLHHKDVAEILRLNLAKSFETLRQTGIEINDPLAYTSDLDAEHRQSILDNFCNLEGNRVLIGSTLAMGEGVDGLQKVCKDFIVLERQWNPANEEQVEGRFVRIGAELNGSISGNYIISIGTIDEYFTELVEQKRATMSQVLDGKEYEWNETSLIQELAETLNRKGLKKWSL